MSKLFSSGARFKLAGAPSSEAKGFTEARSAERGVGVGEGVTPPAGGGPGGLPRENFGKFRVVNAHFKTEKLYEKIALLSKDFILDIPFFKFPLH